MPKFLCICFSATIQKTVIFNQLEKTKVNRSESYIINVSGKALNTQRVLNQLQKDCAIGAYPLGSKNSKFFLKLAKNEKLRFMYVKYPHAYTRECLTLIDKSDNSTTEIVIKEPGFAKRNLLIVRKETRLMNKIDRYMNKVQGLIISGSKDSCWAYDVYGTLTEHAIQKNKIVLLDCTGKTLLQSLDEGIPTIIKINQDEFCSTFNVDPSPDKLRSAIIEKSRELENIVIVTRGADRTYAAENGKFYSIATPKVKTLNTTACGDSFNAGFMFEYLRSFEIQQALEKGVKCAVKNAKSLIPGSLV